VSPHAALVLARFACDAGLSVVWGGGGFALICTGAIPAHLYHQMRTLLPAASGLAAFAGLAAIPIQTAEIVSDWAAALDPDLLNSVAFSTNVGLALLIRALACSVAFAVFLAGYRRAAILLSGLALAEAALLGHAAENWGPAGVLKISAEAIHILAGTAWLGALVPFLVLMQLARQPDLRAEAVKSLRRFSRIGHGAVALVLASGLANSLQILGHLPADMRSAYQEKLALKMAVVLSMTVIATANRYGAVPMQRKYPQLANRLLLLGSSLEIVLGLTAIALVASLGLDDPT